MLPNKEKGQGDEIKDLKISIERLPLIIRVGTMINHMHPLMSEAEEDLTNAKEKTIK